MIQSKYNQLRSILCLLCTEFHIEVVANKDFDLHENGF